jgi:hypothetical protein
MLILGGALKNEYKGKVYNRICSQTDLGSTLLKQLDMSDSAFFWSKNLMNPLVKEFAFYEHNLGFGWIRKEGFMSYDHLNHNYIRNTFPDSIKEKRYTEGASYLQVLVQEFIDL